MPVQHAIKSKIVIGFFFFFLFLQSNAQLLTRTFKKEAVQADIKVAIDSLKRYHPGLYRYISKADFDLFTTQLIASAPDAGDIWDNYSYIAQLTNTVKCGHTRITPPAEDLQALRQVAVFFPLPTRWLHDSLYVCLPGSNGKDTWFHVSSINNMQSKDLLHYLENRFALDGDSREGKQLFFDNLAYYYAALIDRPSSFVLKLKPLEKGSDTLASVAPVTWIALENMRKSQGIILGTGRLFPFSYIQKNGVGVLTVKNFNSARHKAFGVNFKEFLDSVFTEINRASVKHLVIDIRNNGGGDDELGALLYSYLTNKPFRYFETVNRLEAGNVIPVQHPQLEWQRPQPQAYLGRTSLLVDGLTYSTAADFAAIFKEHKRGKVIGMETGGAYQGNNSGESVDVILPYTKLVLTIPLWQYTNAVANKKSKNGVLPDIEVMPSKRWLVTKEDEVMQTALGLYK